MRYSFFTGEDAENVSKWVGSRIPGCELGWKNCVVLLCHMEDQIKGGVVFYKYSPDEGTMSISAAGFGGWFTRKTIRIMHDYAFSDCQLVVWQVSERNALTNKIAERLGYTPYKIPRLAGRDEAQIIWTMTDDDWHQSRFKGA